MRMCSSGTERLILRIGVNDMSLLPRPLDGEKVIGRSVSASRNECHHRRRRDERLVIRLRPGDDRS
jgi:hypothetical protein